NKHRKGFGGTKDSRNVGNVADVMKYLDRARSFGKNEKAISRWDEARIISDLDGWQVDRMLKLARNYVAGRAKVERDSAGELMPGGTVVFGSSTDKDEYGDLVYKMQYALGSLGIPTATGGAGGLMGVANAGAFNAGAPSVGIPVTHLWKE